MSDLEEFYAQVGNTSFHNTVADAPVASQPGISNEWAKTIATASCWAQSGNTYFPVSAVTKSIPPGAYRCQVSQQGPYLERMEIKIDQLLTLPDSATERLLAEFSNFWELRPAFDKRGFTFKRGMLMWGPPGSGKTSAVWQMTERLVKDHQGAVIFVDNPAVATWCLTALRRIEPTRKIVTVTEDIDTVIRHNSEHAMLALLDGENQIDNVVHLATTNYPHLLDRRFVDRPSRFDTVMKVGMPSAAARRVYFKAKEPSLLEDTIERWVDRTEGYSVAHLREVCIATQCFKQDEESVFERLDKMKEILHVNEDGEDIRMGQVGFITPHMKKFGRG